MQLCFAGVFDFEGRSAGDGAKDVGEDSLLSSICRLPIFDIHETRELDEAHFQI